MGVEGRILRSETKNKYLDNKSDKTERHKEEKRNRTG